jgi:DNA-binding MurR/RpiR family transcriptional regulator
MKKNTTMTQTLSQRLKERWESLTASEQRIATYLLRHLRDLPFETAASLSKRVGVSPMTMGRFLRALGYTGLGPLKEELRGDGAWRRLYTRHEGRVESDATAAHLEAEIRALSAVHALPRTPEWHPIVKLLAGAERVSVAAFQNAAFLGQSLATLLQQLRPDVSFSGGTDGAYIDILLDSGPRSCVVLIDARRYFKQFRTLAEQVSARSIPLVLITDTECYWGRDLSPHVLMIDAERLWHSYSAHASLFSLLAASVIDELGDVMERLGDINQLRQRLVGYVNGAVADLPDGASAPARKRGTGRTASSGRRR